MGLNVLQFMELLPFREPQRTCVNLEERHHANLTFGVSEISAWFCYDPEI